MPSYLLKFLQPEGIVAKHTDKPVYQNIGIYYLPGKNKNPAYKIFETKFKQVFEKISQ